MTPKKLLEIISYGESTTVEFKRKATTPMKLAKEIVAMANTVDDNIKVSARVCGKANESINLRDILVKITDGLKVEVGGHKLAAGCLIEGENEKIFIEHTLNILKN